MKNLLIGLIVLSSFSVFATINCGDQVMENYQSWSLQIVKVISNNGKYLLSDDTWYDNVYIQQVECSDCE